MTTFRVALPEFYYRILENHYEIKYYNTSTTLQQSVCYYLRQDRKQKIALGRQFLRAFFSFVFLFVVSTYANLGDKRSVLYGIYAFVEFPATQVPFKG